jgi:hypothetical protein
VLLAQPGDNVTHHLPFPFRHSGVSPCLTRRRVQIHLLLDSDAANLFLSYSQELTVEGMQYLFNQRPINITKYNDKDFVTVEAMVFNVKEGCAYVSGDNPRLGEYTQVCLDK